VEIAADAIFAFRVTGTLCGINYAPRIRSITNSYFYFRLFQLSRRLLPRQSAVSLSIRKPPIPVSIGFESRFMPHFNHKDFKSGRYQEVE